MPSPCSYPLEVWCVRIIEILSCEWILSSVCPSALESSTGRLGGVVSQPLRRRWWWSYCKSGRENKYGMVTFCPGTSFNLTVPWGAQWELEVIGRAKLSEGTANSHSVYCQQLGLLPCALGQDPDTINSLLERQKPYMRSFICCPYWGQFLFYIFTVFNNVLIFLSQSAHFEDASW